MSFEFTSDEAQPIALAVEKFYRKQNIDVSFEKAPWEDAPYRPTIVGVQNELNYVVEAQASFDLHGELEKLAEYIMLKRRYCEMYIATARDSSIPAADLQKMRDLCIGLILVHNELITIHQPARNPALIVNPDPTLKFGTKASEIKHILEKFNYINRKDALRDMVEVVERETEMLLLTAVKKGAVTTPLASVSKKDWSEQIDTLGSASVSTTGSPIISDKLKVDLQSFRGARNLVDHKTRSKREQIAIQRQFAERMAQGPRLFAELVALTRKHSRK
jgi:hypothetical protein